MPKTPETTGMIGAEQLAKMKPTASIVNVARGGLIDESALTGSSYAGFLASRPRAAEEAAISLVVSASRATGGRTHVVHLSDADADYMFFGTLGGSSVNNPVAGGTADVSGAELAYEEAQGVPGFRELTAFQQGNVILVDGSLWTSTGGPILMREIIEFVEGTLL